MWLFLCVEKYIYPLYLFHFSYTRTQQLVSGLLGGWSHICKLCCVLIVNIYFNLTLHHIQVLLFFFRIDLHEIIVKKAKKKTIRSLRCRIRDHTQILFRSKMSISYFMLCHFLCLNDSSKFNIDRLFIDEKFQFSEDWVLLPQDV